MGFARAAMLGMLIGCEPPPPVAGPSAESAITIAYPLTNGDDFPLVCRRNPVFDCNDPDETAQPYIDGLEMLVVIDIDNIELRDPYQLGVEDTPGQGHWHATLQALGGIYAASFQRSVVLVEEQAGTVALGFTSLTVTLQDNTHDPLGPSDTVEMRLVPPREDCALRPEDFCPI